MAISLDKILTISARDWAETERVDLRNYRAVGVHDFGARADMNSNFAEKVPSEASVVVDYRISLTYGGGSIAVSYASSGTALIPREK